jgi:hypothetical protein
MTHYDRRKVPDHSIVNQIITTVKLVIMIMSLYGIYLAYLWYYDKTPVVEFGQGTASQATVRLGEVIVFYQSIKKNISCPGTTQRILLGECGYHVISEVSTYLPAPFEGRVTIPVQIPHYAIPGECSFMIMVRFICTPFDWVKPSKVYQSPRINFKVLGYDE